MAPFSRWLPTLLLPLFLAGCQGLNLGDSEESKTLQPIHYQYTNITVGYDCEMVIGPSGDLILRETRGSAATDTRKIKSTITDAERSGLIAAFKDWKKLEPFYPTDVSPQYIITYGGYSVTTSRLDTMPANFLKAKALLDRVMLILDKAADERQATQAARAAINASATQPETKPAEQPDALPVPLNH